MSRFDSWPTCSLQLSQPSFMGLRKDPQGQGLMKNLIDLGLGQATGDVNRLRVLVQKYE